MTRRKMAKPVRYGEKPSIMPDMIISEATGPNVDIDNCARTHGTPLNIDKPSLASLHFSPANCTTKIMPKPIVTKIKATQSIKSRPQPNQLDFRPTQKALSSGQLISRPNIVTPSPPPLAIHHSHSPTLIEEPFSNLLDPIEELREKAVAIKTCMQLTMEEVEQLVLANKVVRVISNRKSPDQSLKYACKFCIYFNHDTNGEVKMRSFGRKEEIKRHHMLHLRYERFQCEHCPYKVVRSDHLHRHMRNKHPEIFHPGPQSTRRKAIDNACDNDTAQFPGLEYKAFITSSPGGGGGGATVDEIDDDDFEMNLLPSSPALTPNQGRRLARKADDPTSFIPDLTVKMEQIDEMSPISMF